MPERSPLKRIWDRFSPFKAEATTPAPAPPASVETTAPRDMRTDIVYSESLIYALTDWPKYNPDSTVRARGSDIYAKMMEDEQVKAAVHFKRNSITGRKYFFEYDECDLEEEIEDDAGDETIDGQDETKPPKDKTQYATGDTPPPADDTEDDDEDIDPADQIPDDATTPAKKKGLSKEQKEKLRVCEEIIKQMDGSWVDALNGIMSAMYNGFSMSEIVYKQIEVEGKTWWGIKHIRVKPFNSFMFLTDEYGNVQEVKQKWENREHDIDMSKFVHYVMNPDVDTHYGQSDLKAAYRAWFSKDMTIRFLNIHLERHASGMLIIQAREGKTVRSDSAEYTALQNAMTNVSVKTALLLPQGLEGKLEKPNNTDAYESAISLHDKAIAKSLLVPNLLGMSEQGSVGSNAQAQTHLEAFLWVVDMEAGRLEEAINEQLFKRLWELNFGAGPYPRFRFKPISDAVKIALIKTWNELVKGGSVQHTDTDEAHLRKLLDMPEAGEPVQGAVPPGLAGQDPNDPNADPMNDGQQPPGKPRKPKIKPGAPKPAPDDKTIAGRKAIKTARAQMMKLRLAAAEQRVDFAVIDRRSKAIEERFIEKLTDTFQNGVTSIKSFVRTHDLKKNPDLINDITFPAGIKRKLSEQMGGGLDASWSLGVDHARREIQKAKGEEFGAANKLPRDSQDKYIESSAQRFTADVTGNAQKRIATILFNGIKDDWTTEEMIQRIDDEMDSYSMPQLATAVRTMTFEAMNDARYDYFTQPVLGGFVEAFQYSAIIDGRTTEICEHLDGSIYPVDSDYWSTYSPPNHFNCRSLLVAVTTDDQWTESDPPNLQPEL